MLYIFICKINYLKIKHIQFFSFLLHVSSVVLKHINLASRIFSIDKQKLILKRFDSTCGFVQNQYRNRRWDIRRDILQRQQQRHS